MDYRTGFYGGYVHAVQSVCELGKNKMQEFFKVSLYDFIILQPYLFHQQWLHYVYTLKSVL